MADASPAARSAKGTFAVVAVFALGIVFGAALTVVLFHFRGGFPRGGMHGGMHGGGPDEPVNGMMKELGLSADQEKQIRAIMDATHAEVHAKLAETHQKIREILTSEQREKFDKMFQMRSPFPPGGHRGPGRDGPPPGEPPQDRPPEGGPPPGM